MAVYDYSLKVYGSINAPRYLVVVISLIGQSVMLDYFCTLRGVERHLSLDGLFSRASKSHCSVLLRVKQQDIITHQHRVLLCYEQQGEIIDIIILETIGELTQFLVACLEVREWHDLLCCQLRDLLVRKPWSQFHNESMREFLV